MTMGRSSGVQRHSQKSLLMDPVRDQHWLKLWKGGPRARSSSLFTLPGTLRALVFHTRASHSQVTPNKTGKCLCGRGEPREKCRRVSSAARFLPQLLAILSLLAPLSNGSSFHHCPAPAMCWYWCNIRAALCPFQPGQQLEFKISYY